MPDNLADPLPHFKPSNIGYLGDDYSFTQLASMKFADIYSPDPANPYRCLSKRGSIFELVKAVRDKELDAAVVPIENMGGGGYVAEAIDAIDGYSKFVKIFDSIVTPIKICIGGKCPKDKIVKIVSKQEALNQTTRHRIDHFKGVETEKADSTVAGMELIRDVPGYEFAAGVGSREALEHYGLDIYDEDIGNIKPNKTRFLLVKRGVATPNMQPEGIQYVTTIAVEPTFGPFDDLGYELETLARKTGVKIKGRQARTSKNNPQAKTVFLDLVGRPFEGGLEIYLEKLKDSEHLLGHRVTYKNLGHWRYADFFEKLIRTVGVIGKKELNDTLVDFYRRCGFDTVVSDDEDSNIEEVADRSDILVLNRVGPEGLRVVMPRIKEYLDEKKLLVVNTQMPKKMDEILSELGTDSKLLYIDALFVNWLPVQGQKVVFMGEGVTEPGSPANEFVGAYQEMNTFATITDFETHEKMRCHNAVGSRMSALWQSHLTGKLGTNFKDGRKHAFPAEAAYTDQMQVAGSGETENAAETWFDIAQSRPDIFTGFGDMVSNIPNLTKNKIRDMLKQSTKQFDDVTGAQKRVRKNLGDAAVDSYGKPRDNQDDDKEINQNMNEGL